MKIVILKKNLTQSIDGVIINNFRVNTIDDCVTYAFGYNIIEGYIETFPDTVIDNYFINSLGVNSIDDCVIYTYVSYIFARYYIDKNSYTFRYNIIDGYAINN